MITAYAQNSLPSLVCTKLFISSKHTIQCASTRWFSLQVKKSLHNNRLQFPLGHEDVLRESKTMPMQIVGV